MNPTPQTDQYKELGEILDEVQAGAMGLGADPLNSKDDALQALIQYIEKREVESRINELRRLKLSGTPDKMTDILVEVPELTTKDDVGLISIDDRINMLTKLKGGNHD